MLHRIRFAPIVSVLLLALACAPALAGVIYYVAPNGNDSFDGLSWPMAKRTITAALILAQPGDEVRVAQGTYNENITLLPGQSIKGGYAGAPPDPDARDFLMYPTIINGGHNGQPCITILTGSGRDTLVDGFVIMNGFAPNGAGILIKDGASPTISNNTIQQNHATALGGGIYCGEGSGPLIELNMLKGNLAASGGGIYCARDCTAEIRLNTIDNNQAISGNGGGIACVDCNPQIRQNTFCGNMATAGSGGAIHCDTASPAIDNNNIGQCPTGNMAGLDGGGIACVDNSNPGIGNNRITYNQAGRYGGGISCDASSPTIGGNTAIDNNTAQSGGGIACVNVSKPEISENNIGQNQASLGGGIYCATGSDAHIDHNTIRYNTAGSGGGVYIVTCSPTVMVNSILSNIAGTGNGGGVCCMTGCQSLILLNTIDQNRANAGMGGGIYCQACAPEIIDNMITRNIAQAGGAGVALRLSADATLNNNTIADNTTPGEGGGVYIEDSDPSLTNNIVAYNSSGLYKDSTSSPALSHNDVWGNGAYQYSGWSADPTGTNGNISIDPKFVNRTGGDYHLQSDSPCIDAGDNSVVGADESDIDGEFRIAPPGSGVVDIGADEYQQGKLAPPVLTPGPGTYSDSICVYVQSGVPGAVVHYTLDGTDPDENDPVIGPEDCITISATTTIKARAFLDPYDPSDVTEGLYTITKVADPEFDPGGGWPMGGWFDEEIDVTITCPTPGATIHYTIDGTSVTEESPVIANGGTIHSAKTNKLRARAWKAGMDPSNPVEAQYVIKTYFVVEGIAEGGDGKTWSGAFGHIQDAIDTCPADEDYEVWVTPKRLAYNEWKVIKEHFTTKSGVALYGGFWGWEERMRVTPNDKTILSGLGVDDQVLIRVPAYASDRTIIDGFTIRDGFDTEDGGGICCEMHSAPIIRNNKFLANGWRTNDQGYIIYSAAGGAISTDARSCALIEDNHFEGNKAATGGAIYIHGGGCGENVEKPMIRRNTFQSNNSSIYGGGAITAGGQVYITDNEFRGNGTEGDGGAIHVQADNDGAVRIWDNIIEGNSANNGGGISVYDHACRIDHNYIAGNGYCYFGGGIYLKDVSSTLSESVVIEHNEIIGNSGPQICPYSGGGIAVMGGYDYACITNNIIAENGAALQGGGIWTNGLFVEIVNNNILANGAGDPSGHCGGGILIVDADNTTTIANNLVWMNSRNGIELLGNGSYPDHLLICNNDVWDNTPNNYAGMADQTGINGNISTSPIFQPNSMRLDITSPCIDTGDNSYVRSAKDWDEQDRTNGTVDMGIDEFWRADAPTFQPPSGTYAGSVTVHIYGTPNIHYTIDGSEPTKASTLYTGPFAVTASATVKAKSFPTDPALWPSEVSSISYTIRDVLHLKVDKDAPGPEHDGSTWQKAFLTIQAAIDSGLPGDEVWVAEGTYHERLSIDGRNVYGGFAATETSRDQRKWWLNETTIDADAQGCPVSIVSQSALPGVIDGFTITGGYPADGVGSGVYCGVAQSVIANNTIIDNDGNTVGGIGFYAGDGLIINNVIAGNSANYSGGGIYCSNNSWPRIVNNTIVGNTAPQGAVGIYCGTLAEPSVRLYNNIVTGNYRGILVAANANATLHNNNSWGNTADNYPGSVSVDNISQDPRYVNVLSRDYRLQADSPCIDTGSNSAPGLPQRDLDGNPRIQDGNADGTAAADMGAYERAGVMTLPQVKLTASDGQYVVFGQVSATARRTAISSIFVETLDRTCGIRVHAADVSAFSFGQVMTVAGTVEIDDPTGEVYIEAATGYPQPTGETVELAPMFMHTRAMGGAAFGLQEGIEGASGLNSIGLFIRTCGTVTFAGTDYFYIDDGGAIDDGSGSLGVKAKKWSGTPPSVGQYVYINGVITCYKDSEGKIRRMVW